MAKMNPYPRMRLTIDWCGMPSEVDGRRLTSNFAAWRKDRRECWRVTHIGTGYRAQGDAPQIGLRTLQQAGQYARGLERRFGAKAWRFTDPEAVKELKGAGKVCRELAARVVAASR
jgi:hypothetical protein